MKAAVYHGKNDIRVEDVPVREIDADKVLTQSGSATLAAAIQFT